MTPFMIHHSYKGRVKVSIMFDPVSVRDVAGQRDKRQTEEKGKVIKWLMFSKTLFAFLFLISCHSGYLAKQTAYNRILANS